MNESPIELKGVIRVHPTFVYSREFIQKIRDHRAFHYVLCATGPTGNGRTLWAKSLWQTFQSEVAGCFWHIDPADSSQDVLHELLRQLIRGLNNCLSVKHAQNLEALPGSLSMEELAKYALKLSSLAMQEGRITLLVIDDFDNFNPVQIEFLMARLFRPLVQNQNAAILLTSETEQRFETDYLLYDSQENVELITLDLPQVQSAYPKYQLWAEEICALTGGQMALLEALVELLDQKKVLPEHSSRLPEQVIDIFYRQRLEAIIFENIPELLKSRMLVLALLRRFDIKVLPKLMEVIFPSQGEPFGMAESLKLIASLKGRVYWRNKEGGYALVDSMRLALEKFIYHEHRDLFLRVHKAAVQVYRELINEDYRQSDLLEFLYHALQILKHQHQLQDREMKDHLDVELAEFLDGEQSTNLEGADFDSLRRTLPNDPDLAPYISLNVIDYIETQMKMRAIEEKVLRPREIKYHPKDDF